MTGQSSGLKNAILFISIVILGAINAYLLVNNFSLKEDEELANNKVLGVKSALVTAEPKIEKAQAQLEWLTKDNGKAPKNDYKKRRENVEKLVGDFYQSSKAILKAHKDNDLDKVESLKKDIGQTVNLKTYRDYEWLRDDDWTMVSYDTLPDLSQIFPESYIVGIVDGDGKTLALLAFSYLEDEKMLSLVNATVTMDWSQSTDAYQTGSGEVGILQDDKSKKGGDNND